MGLKSNLVGLVNGIDPLRKFVSKRAINEYANKTPPRPRPFSMASGYTTWPSLTDRRYSGRHLARIEGEKAPAHPDIDKVVALFERPAGGFRKATDTSILFPFFAQWFTDSFLRTKWEQPGQPRTFRENESNHEIDLCQIYGMSETQTRMLREWKGGRLKTQERNGETWPAPLFDEAGGELRPEYRRTPEQDEDHPAIPGLYTPGNFRRVYNSWDAEARKCAFAVGLEHGNSTLGNTMMNTLFVRQHNRIAGELEKAYGATPGWDDERLFQTARNINIVILLNIVVSDYIVHIAPIDVRLEAEPGMAEHERWYRNNWMAVEFALLYRWHDLVPEELVVDGQSLPGSRMRRANAWLIEHGLDKVVLAASQQHAGRLGLGNTAKFLTDPPPAGSDVKRLSLEMARACGLPSYNDYREHYGLKRMTSFEALTRDKTTAAKLKALYGDIERLEWFVGLFAEGYDDSAMMGQLMISMVANDAFTQALTNPLLAEAVHTEATFSKVGLEIIDKTRTLAQVIANNSGVKDPKRVGFKVRKAA
jgi:prostaglandin-endoperoxide synthase 2